MTIISMVKKKNQPKNLARPNKICLVSINILLRGTENKDTERHSASAIHDMAQLS